ncbi:MULTISPECIES: polyphosphate kinase 2 [Agrobacterium]|jgi:polyphosphate kinase 2|uniref:ADP/GDP-polyphosphate phosphotransferase n=2 Tax=Agrobacterium tumefaciens complex TaxID=1183400 RepID=A0AAP9E0I2_AGRTU|nr:MULTISPECIES: polyphosphate kinase 2 [Agrobacterium]MCP2132953.1 polyphosphate kinase 2 [Rhizobium sp. SLBN-94]TGE81842.1 polyphosphate kinase 2 [Rhizobium sp. SEMIA 439]KAA1235977.1 polyphosphate kinase 2 [Agrobacterium tumefaciens]KAB0459886.1 polyphosphate kinase 2 [Agrobacterium tumefaciens]KWT76979.1 UDP-galactose-lipid carrier transferase [Agrobacterium radiobacter]
MGEETKKRTVEITIGGKLRSFDIDNPVLPEWVEEKKLSAGNFPYDKKMKREEYDTALEALQVELVKVQFWLQATGKRVMAVFEGRDAAGKGGAIFAARAYLNPRYARVVALTKPTETERGQWYFQRYISHFPTAGEFVLFDRSWYNRAGVEPVMGFCTPEEHKLFLKETPRLEKMLAHEDINLFKFWLDIGRETQIERFHDRRHSPLKCWKLSDMDIAALTKWDDYTQKRDEMLEKTHTDAAPWTVVRANDKRRTRVNLIRHILLTLDYEGKDEKAIGEIDDKILGSGPDFLK